MQTYSRVWIDVSRYYSWNEEDGAPKMAPDSQTASPLVIHPNTQSVLAWISGMESLLRQHGFCLYSSHLGSSASKYVRMERSIKDGFETVYIMECNEAGCQW